MHSKSQVRWSGPLEPFAAGFDAELARLGYTPAGTRRKLEAAAHLSCWLAERGMTADDLGDETIAEFTAARRAAGHASQLTGRSLAWMLGYLRGLGAVRPAADPGPAAGAGHLLERFGAFLADERGLAAKTRGAHLDSARRFLSAAGRAGETGPPVSALTASDVTAFLVGMARVQAPGTTQNTASMLRTFLTWLYADGLIASPLAGTVPGAYRRRRVRMPALVTEAEAAALLAACDRTAAQGLRDYAIVLTLTRMGLRAREIAALTIEDVDWRSGIVVISGKGGRRDQLPLPRDVAEAIIGYLRDGRAAAALDRRLFVRSVAPHRGLTGYGVGHAVARASRDAGLDRVRPHQLRYFAATAMQAAGAPLAEIGQVLRHEDERTTSLYAREGRRRRPAAAGPSLARAVRAPASGRCAVNPPARPLAGHLDDYLTLRRALGCKLIRAERYLGQFLDYLGERQQGTLTVEAAADWVRRSRHGSAAPGLGMEAIRGFAAFLHAHDPAHEIPSPGLFPRRRVRAVPYLYSPADIAALQAAAGRLRGPLRAETYTVLIALLAVTGLRIGEAIALDDGDIDTGEGMLTVRQDKAQSFRLVPLHPTALAALAGYRHRRDQAFPGRAAPAVLVSRTGDRLTYNAVHKTFTRLAAAAGLGPRTGRCRPVIHGLRHSFAVNMLAGWYRDGADVPACLPWLSTVMGHSGPASTYWYLSASPELMALAAQRLQAHIDRAAGAPRAGRP